MNQKHAKRLRKQLRKKGIDYRIAEYEYNEERIQQQGRMLRTMRLVPTCGKARYRRLKSAHKANKVQ